MLAARGGALRGDEGKPRALRGIDQVAPGKEQRKSKDEGLFISGLEHRDRVSAVREPELGDAETDVSPQKLEADADRDPRRGDELTNSGLLKFVGLRLERCFPLDRKGGIDVESLYYPPSI